MRKEKPARMKKQVVLSIRIPYAVKQNLHFEAIRKGIGLSEYARHVLMGHAEKLNERGSV